MAKTVSFLRTSPGQVIPDTTLNRRINIPFSVGVPVEKAKRTFPLHGRNSVFDNVDIKMVYSEKKGNIDLVYSQPIYTTNLAGKGSAAMKSFKLFSDAAKMGCPSMSLPAGPQREGGTCAAAGARASSMKRPARGKDVGGSRRDKDGNIFICDNCYATSGNYWYASTSVAQAGRLAWILRHLKSDPSGASLAGDLIWAIDSVARRADYGNLTNRMGQEIGVWSNGQIHVPGLIKHRGKTMVPLLVTDLPPWSGFKNTTEYFARMGTPEGAVAGFFRIHDSGDLNVGTKVSTWKGYLNAWTRVCLAFPYVRFWIPVRTYQNKAMREALQEAAKTAPNFVIRASPLFVNADPPMIEGLASSAVHSTEKVKDGWYACPVGESDDSSCTKSGCRVCWINKDMIPSYREH